MSCFGASNYLLENGRTCLFPELDYPVRKKMNSPDGGC